MLINLSIKSYILFPRNVTLQPTGKPLRILKFDISCLDLVITGFWPDINVNSWIALSNFFGLSFPSPIPILIEMWVRQGTSILLL